MGFISPIQRAERLGGSFSMENRQWQGRLIETRTLGMSMALADLGPDPDREDACPLEVSRLRAEQKRQPNMRQASRGRASITSPGSGLVCWAYFMIQL